jgi:PiT family inorganic phosphate transporter
LPNFWARSRSRNAGVANRTFRLGQLASGTWVAFTHGANDAQKTMGVIGLALFESGHLSRSFTRE